jgi:hypothetical protein
MFTTMKNNILMVLFIAIIVQPLFAQPIRELHNYPHSATLKIEKLQAIIEVNQSKKIFELASKNNLLEFRNPDEVLIFLKLNDIHKASLKSQYDTITNGKFYGMHLANQIVNRAKELGGIRFGADANTLQVVDDANNVLPDANIITHENANGAEYIEAKKSNNNLSNIWPWLAGIIASIILGFALGRQTKKDKLTVEVEEDSITISNKENAPIKTSKRQVTIGELREISKVQSAEIKNLKKEINTVSLENKNSQQQFLQFQTNQKAIFEAVNTKVISPYLKAVEESNVQAIAASALKGIALLTSITRTHKNLRQEYDIQNINNLLNIPNNNSSKEINAQTFSDDIPKDIKAIIEVMRKNNISEISDISFFGYTIKKI